MGLSRDEVNLRRLLARCELTAKNRQNPTESIESYVETLETMFNNHKSSLSSPESIANYQRRIIALKKDLNLTTKYTYEEAEKSENERDALFGVRHRGGVAGEDQSGDVGQVLEYHENMQKKITDEMLVFTKNLKEQSELASRVIKKDTECVSKSANLTDQNLSRLSVESAKLSEHSKRAWKCWMWIMLAIVMVVFINMVLFMKVMKKSL